MKLRRARLVPYRLPLLRGLSTAHGQVLERRGWLLELETDSGEVGRGDACPFPGDENPAAAGDAFGMESWPDCGERLEGLAAGLMGRGVSEALAFLDSPEGSAPDAPAARFALDCALSELAARSRACSVATWLAQAQGHGAQARLAVSALVSGGCEEEIVAEAAALGRAGFQTFKLKLGGRPRAEELVRVKALRGALGPGPRFGSMPTGLSRPARRLPYWRNSKAWPSNWWSSPWPPMTSKVSPGCGPRALYASPQTKPWPIRRRPSGSSRRARPTSDSQVSQRRSSLVSSEPTSSALAWASTRPPVLCTSRSATSRTIGSTPRGQDRRAVSVQWCWIRVRSPGPTGRWRKPPYQRASARPPPSSAACVTECANEPHVRNCFRT